MIWEAALGVITLKASVLLGLWFNRRRIGARLAGPQRLDSQRLALRIAKELELTADGRADLEVWLSGYARQLDELRRHNAGLRLRLLDEVAGAAPDRARLNDMYADKRALVEQAYVSLREKFLAFHARLSPGQRLRLADLLERSAGHPAFSHPLLP